MPSSSSSHCWNHDVFLSFRGTDTRKNFTSHLYHALSNKGINTFIDDKLERGEEISHALLEVIEGSKISIVVFSQDYALSSYCLDELVKILECRESKGQEVFPVFYKVDPGEVKEQKDRFGEAFAMLKAFTKDSEKVHMWTLALANTADLAGWHLDNEGDEGDFIKSLVDTVVVKLNSPILNVAEHTVGLDSHMKEMDYKLSIESNDVRMIGIIGTGGIGKTTIAKAIFNRFANQFEGSCFLASVREFSKKHGAGYLQETLLFKILGNKRNLMGNFHRGINEIKDMLQGKRVLIVIDDVDDDDQLKSLAGGIDWFGGGSRIIITTRDKHLLDVHGVKIKHEMKELCTPDALQLFSWNAFKQSWPTEGYMELSHRAVDYAKGLPLALVLLGSSLYGRNMYEWRNELDNLERFPNKKLYEILKTSYDGLVGNEQAIFLDIACFFRGMDKDYVIKILDACDLKPVIGVQVLIEKSLISIENKKLQMHDLVQSMGRQVVYEQSHMPGRRSRLWFHEDVIDVLQENMGTEEIEGIMLDSPQLEKIKLSTEAFTRMKSLRILILRNAQFAIGQVNLPNNLRWLEWPGCPLSSMPSAFQARRLVGFDIHNSCITQFGDEFKNYRYLKFLDLKDCSFLKNTPNFSAIPNLERLNLESCTELVAVHESLGCLPKLEFLSLEFCSNLRFLPSSFRLRSLQTLLLNDCRKLQIFPDIPEKMTCLEKVSLSRTSIEVLPSSVENFTGLKVFTLTYCKNLANLPSSIYKLKHLKSLFLEGCSKLGNFPMIDGNKVQPKFNDSAINFGSDIRSSFPWYLPPTMTSGSSYFLYSYLTGFPELLCLDLRNCNLSDVNFLMAANCFSMLKDLDLSENNFISLPPSIRLLSNLRSLKLSKCMKLKEIPDLPPNIKRVEARDCKLLDNYLQLGSLFKYYKGLKPNRLHDIDISNCHKLVENQDKILQSALGNAKESSFETFHLGVEAFRQDSRIEMILPASDIPEWFNYVCEGSCLVFELSPDIARSIIALVFCVILRLEEGSTANISREFFIDGRNVISFSREFFSLDKDHLWLYYFPCRFTRNLCSQQNDMVHCEVSFKDLRVRTGSSLRNCGVYFVCEENETVIEDVLGDCLSLDHQLESSSINLARSGNNEELLQNWSVDFLDHRETKRIKLTSIKAASVEKESQVTHDGKQQGGAGASCGLPSTSTAPPLTKGDDESGPCVGSFDTEQKRILEIIQYLKDPNQSEDFVVDLLQSLEGIDASVKTLKETRIATHVTCWKNHSSEDVRRLVKQLVRKWREVVDKWLKLNAPGISHHLC